VKLRITLAYDGRPWKGWQSQPGGETIQDQLEAAVLKLTGQRTSLYGSGRTDAGVHARAQVAHFEVTDCDWKMEAWQRALNATLPLSIRVLHCEPVDDDFHARFSAKGKVYEYRIWRGDQISPFEVGLAWHLHGALDMTLLSQGAQLICGPHNFARLSANRGDISEVQRRENAEGLTRTIQRVEVHEEGDILRFEFEGDGFLYKMVRLMVGSLVHVARGRSSVDWIRELVEEPEGTKSHHCAPADGLYLVRVKY
jgi:tRNA pseudouridine38-40 synthase